MDAVKQDAVNGINVIIGKDEKRVRQVEIDTVEVFVVEAVVLRLIDEVCQNPDDFLPLFGPADLIQFVDENDWVHTLMFHEYIDNASPC